MYTYTFFLFTNSPSSFRALKELHTEGFLTKIKESDTFLNIEKIRDIHLVFWEECVEPLIQAARDSGEPLNPEVLTGAR